MRSDTHIIMRSETQAYSFDKTKLQELVSFFNTRLMQNFSAIKLHHYSDLGQGFVIIIFCLSIVPAFCQWLTTIAALFSLG